MAVKYSKIFTVTGAITREPVTILVEQIETESFRGVSIRSLEGDYPTTEEYKKELNRILEKFAPSTRIIKYRKELGLNMKESDVKLFTSINLMVPGARQLMEAINGALQASARARN